MSIEDELGDEIATLSAHLDAATQRLLDCIRRFDQGGGWEKQGAVSCAHWLSWRVGLDLATAREKVRVARALGGLPRIDAALGRGEISYAKTRAMTRVATTANEERLLELARTATGAQLERICRGYRQVAASLNDQGPLPEERSVAERILPGGMVKLELVLHPDEASLVRAALETAREHLRQGGQPDERQAGAAASAPPTDVSAEASRSVRATAAEGSPSMPATAAEASPSVPATAAEASPSVPATAAEGSPSVRAAAGERKWVAVREDRSVSLAEAAVHVAQVFLASGQGSRPGSAIGHQLFVHLDEDVLGADGEWGATLDDGTRLPAETLRRVACDAGLVATMTDGSGAVLDIGRRTRTIPPAIRRALWVRDRGCRWPGCRHTRFLHGHHIQHWLHGGATSLENMILLCSRHHQLVHEGGATIEADASAGTLAFRTPAGGRLPAVPPPHVVEDAVNCLRAWADERALELGPDTALPWWDGSAPDYDWTIAALMG